MGLSVPDYFTTFTAENMHGPINTNNTSFNSKLFDPISAGLLVKPCLFELPLSQRIAARFGKLDF